MSSSLHLERNQKQDFLVADSGAGPSSSAQLLPSDIDPRPKYHSGEMVEPEFGANVPKPLQRAVAAETQAEAGELGVAGLTAYGVVAKNWDSLPKDAYDLGAGWVDFRKLSTLILPSEQGDRAACARAAQAVGQTALLLTDARIKSIVGRDGLVFSRIKFHSELHKAVYKKTRDLTKANIAADLFARHFGDASFQVKAIVQKLCAKYPLFLGANCGNARKIFFHRDTLQLLQKEEHSEAIRLLVAFFSDFEFAMKKALGADKAPGQNSQPELSIVYCEAGGGHKVAAEYIERALAGSVRCHSVNESELNRDDGMARTFGLSISDLYNELFQKLNEPSYYYATRRLSKAVDEFIPAAAMDRLRAAVGDAPIVVSTTHWAHNVALVADKNSHIFFQATNNYGIHAANLLEVARAVARYGLDGIEFLVPSSNSDLAQTALESLEQPAPSAIRSMRLHVLRHDRKSINRSASCLVRAEYLGRPDHAAMPPNFHVHEHPAGEAWRAPINSERVRSICEAYKLRADAHLLTCAVGAQGVGKILESYIEDVIRGYAGDLVSGLKPSPLDVLAVCGRNHKLFHNVSLASEKIFSEVIADMRLSEEMAAALRQGLRIKTQAFVPNEDLAAIVRMSSAVIVKAGPTTAAELLAANVHKPFVHHEKSHYWEEGNLGQLKQQLDAYELRGTGGFYRKLQNHFRQQRALAQTTHGEGTAFGAAFIQPILSAVNAHLTRLEATNGSND